MTTLILAGGLGTRLRPLTNHLPKPMIEVAGFPFIYHQIELLKHFGLSDFIISTGYLSDKIKEYLKDGKHLNVKISYSHVERPLGTGGATRLAKGLLREDFLLLNGDDIPILNWRAFLDFVGNSKSNVMVIHKREAGGNVEIDSQSNLITRYGAKRGEKKLVWTHSGLCFLKRRVLEDLPEGSFDIETRFYNLLAKKGDLFYFMSDGITLSIGTLEHLRQTRKKLTDYLAKVYEKN